MKGAINDGFSQFGSLLSGTGSKVLGSIGNLFNMFGKEIQNGTIVMGDNMLQAYQKIAGTLGTVES